MVVVFPAPFLPIKTRYLPLLERKAYIKGKIAVAFLQSADFERVHSSASSGVRCCASNTASAKFI